jgi:hypothetical protein
VPAALRGVASHRLLDRLIAGKAWIAVVAFALIGIVTLQLALLQLNTSIGRSLVRASGLERTDAALSIENSEMAAGDRVESRAAQLGMELVPVGALRFLGAHPRSDVGHAVGALSSTVQPSASPEATSTAAGAGGAHEAAGGAAGEAEHGVGATQPAAGEAAAAGQGAPAAGEASHTASSAPAAAAPEASTATPSGGGAATPAGGAAASGAGQGTAAPAGESAPAGGTQAGPAG